MFKRKIMALIFFVCVICSGVVYAGWVNQKKVDVNAKAGKLEYEVGNRNKCTVTLSNGEQEYTVLPTNMELVFGERANLIVTVSKETLDQNFEGNEQISSIKLDYEVHPTDNNTINSIKVNNTKDEIRAGCGVNNNATQGELDSNPINMNCVLKSSPVVGNSNNQIEAIDILQDLNLKRPLVYTKNQALEFDVGILISQSTQEDETENNTINSRVDSLLFTYCLWNQTINLHCKLVII